MEGHPAVFSIDLMLLHEVTSAQAFEALEERKIKVAYPHRLLATIDHSIPTRDNRHEIYDEAARAQVQASEKIAASMAFRFTTLIAAHRE